MQKSRSVTMRIRLSCLVLPSLLSISLGAGAAHAQAKQTDAAAKAEADRAQKEGERLLAQHEGQRAVEQLQRAYKLAPNAKLLLPLGMAYAEAERPLDAVDALSRFLKEAPALPDAKRKEVGGKLQVMLDQVAAVVTIEATRENAAVKVDGRQIGVTPIEAPLRLLPGKHEIILAPAATDPSSGAKAVIDVRPGERKAVKLEPGARSKFLEPQTQNEEPVEERPRKVAARDKVEDEQSVKVDTRTTEIHKKWWFWTAVGGGVAVLAVGLGAGLGSRGGGGTQVGDVIPKSPDWAGGPIDARGGALTLLRGTL